MLLLNIRHTKNIILTLGESMGTDICGYVEINTVEFSDENLWFNIIDISLIVERDYSIYNILFGIRNEKDSFAHDRGIPKDSSLYKSDEFKHESIVGHSYILYSEIKENINKIPIDQYSWGWNFIFETMEKLSSHYGIRNVRLVVAFDNYG